MRTILPCIFLILHFSLSAQITTPVVRAGFGVDGDLRANFFNNFALSGNDDWFNNGTAGTGQFVIDTNGVSAMMANWVANPASRRLPFYRTMRVPQFSLVNNRLWIDAVYIRDYNGTAGGDSTAFVSSNKNGDSPQNWTGGVTSVLDKNDIAEMMIHVRRAGPTKNDSLWFFGGISLQGTSGNRYFDFELYQTDIFYTRSTGKFTNFGPDAGHTSWEFDANGNIIKPGDVIFTAEYGSSSLTFLEARIWVHKDSRNMTPAGFSWGTSFDGGGPNPTYGYASITPKTEGTYYTGLQAASTVWAGPFGFIDNSNNILSTYTARQFMEFSVNLTKLGLDPITLLGGDACGLPFRRILVKTRTSTAFTSEVKDFIGPFDFFTTPPVKIMTDVAIYCGTVGVSEVFVTNPSSAAVYTWSTPNGNIVGDTVGTSITVNSPGMYIVKHQLLDGCSSTASDTVNIIFDPFCTPLDHKITRFKGAVKNRVASLNWNSHANHQTEYFELQRSEDGIRFETISRINGDPGGVSYKELDANDDLSSVQKGPVFYRLKVRMIAGNTVFTNTLKLDLPIEELQVNLYPNPVGKTLQMTIPSIAAGEARLTIFDASGAALRSSNFAVQEGMNQMNFDVSWLKPGFYLVHIVKNNQNVWKKFVVSRNLVN
jgi:hypothetical protein